MTNVAVSTPGHPNVAVSTPAPANVAVGIPTGGGGGQYLRFNQATDATTWTITHNFGLWPLVQCFDTTGAMIGVDVTHTSLNQCQISFAPGISTHGVAILVA